MVEVWNPEEFLRIPDPRSNIVQCGRPSMKVIPTEFKDLPLQRKKLEQWINVQLPPDKVVLQAALEMATAAHAGQERDGGGAYIIHPIRSALILIEELRMNNREYIVTLLLHDLVEDTSTTLEQVRQRFGGRVAFLVDNLTRPRPEGETEEEKNLNKGRSLQSYFSADKEIRLLKCVDVLDNMRSWSALTPNQSSHQKFRRWMGEAEKYYFPLADKTNLALAVELRQAVSSAFLLWGSAINK